MGFCNNNNAIKFSQRCVASYPSPASFRSESKSRRKKFNYLNEKRLVEVEKGVRSRRAIRQRDDIFLHRRVQYREAIKESVEKQIRYFSESIKKYVFFKGQANNALHTGFHGMRKAPGWVSRRILHIVEDEILKPKNRQHLIELIESTGVAAPTKGEWLRYTDKNGNIKINLYYHPFLEMHMRRFFTSVRSFGRFRLLQAFIVLNRNNFDVCPPLRTWSLRQGPVRDEELVERGSQKEVRDIIAELTEYQRSYVFRAYNKLTDEEKENILKYAKDNRDVLLSEYERERLFGARIMCGVTALKEIRSMTNPAFTYYNEEFYKFLIRRGGAAGLTLRQSKNEVASWYSLPKETRKKYYCFEQSTEMHPVGGAHLYIRYCSRDYGLSREKSMEKWAGLSDLQKAALNFCFYAPITSPRRACSAFTRFYYQECHRHGLIMTGKACGNKAFLFRVRKKWLRMNADERAQYEDTESFASVFPLHRTPSSSSSSSLGEHTAAAASGAVVLNGDTNGAPKRHGTVAINAARGDCDVEDEGENAVIYFEDEVIKDDKSFEDNQLEDMQVLEHVTMMGTRAEGSVVFTV